MRTEDDDEIIDPGTYDLGDGARLHVWIVDADEPELWACSVPDHGPMCRLCQPIDGVLNACLVNVIDGQMICKQDAEGQFHFKVTKAGEDRVRAMIKEVDHD